MSLPVQPRRPRVLLVTNQDWGHFAHRLPLARALADAGFEAVFVANPGRYASRLEEAGFRFVPWRLDRRSINPLKEIAPLFRLTRIYRRERPVATFQFTIKVILHGSMAARLSGLPAVVNAFTGVGFPFLNTGPSRYYRPFLAPVLRRLLGRPNTVTLFHNEEDRLALIEQRLVTADRSVAIPSSGVNTERFQPTPHRVTEKVPVVLMAARLLWDKGVAEYVEAARLARANGIAARFLLAGEPDPGSTVAIDDLQLAKWRREGVVEFLGHRDDMADLLRDADIAVLPSHHEGVPRSLLEASASGLPIVATDVGGCRLVVEPGVNGTLVPVSQPVRLYEALRPLLTDEGLRGRMGQASRKIALERFSEADAMAAHIAILRGLGVMGNAIGHSTEMDR